MDDPVASSEGYPARLMAEIRRRDPELAMAMDDEEAGLSSLTEVQRARLDAWRYGHGYLVSGRRVDPRTVMIVQAPE